MHFTIRTHSELPQPPKVLTTTTSTTTVRIPTKQHKIKQQQNHNIKAGHDTSTRRKDYTPNEVVGAASDGKFDCFHFPKTLFFVFLETNFM